MVRRKDFLSQLLCIHVILHSSFLLSDLAGSGLKGKNSLIESGLNIIKICSSSNLGDGEL